MAWTKTEKNEKLNKLSDVNFSNLSEGQILAYDETNGTWENTNFIDDNYVSQNTIWSSYKTNQQINSITRMLPQKKQARLPAGSDGLIIDDRAFFVDNKSYWVSTNKFGVMPTNINVNVESGYISLRFEPQDTDIEVEVIKI